MFVSVDERDEVGRFPAYRSRDFALRPFFLFTPTNIPTRNRPVRISAGQVRTHTRTSERRRRHGPTRTNSLERGVPAFPRRWLWNSVALRTIYARRPARAT